MTLTMLLSEQSLVLQMVRVEEEFPSIRYKAVQVYTVTYPMLDIKLSPIVRRGINIITVVVFICKVL